MSCAPSDFVAWFSLVVSLAAVFVVFVIAIQTLVDWLGRHK